MPARRGRRGCGEPSWRRVSSRRRPHPAVRDEGGGGRRNGMGVSQCRTQAHGVGRGGASGRVRPCDPWPPVAWRGRATCGGLRNTVGPCFRVRVSAYLNRRNGDGGGGGSVGRRGRHDGSCGAQIGDGRHDRLEGRSLGVRLRWGRRCERLGVARRLASFRARLCGRGGEGRGGSSWGRGPSGARCACGTHGRAAYRCIDIAGPLRGCRHGSTKR